MNEDKKNKDLEDKPVQNVQEENEVMLNEATQKHGNIAMSKHEQKKNKITLSMMVINMFVSFFIYRFIAEFRLITSEITMNKRLSLAIGNSVNIGRTFEQGFDIIAFAISIFCFVIILAVIVLLTSEKRQTEVNNMIPKNVGKYKNIKVGLLIILLFFIGSQLASEYKLSAINPQNIFIDNLINAIDGYFANPFKLPKFSMAGFITGMAFNVIFYLTYMYMKFNKKNFRPQEEHGSARRGDIYKEASKLNALNNPRKEMQDKFNNMILSENILIDLDTWHTHINDNIFAMGGSGSGKTRFFVKPNLLQFQGNYVAIDPKGSVIKEVGNGFVEEGYEIRTLNLVDMKKSMKYNPFVYFKSPTDIQDFVSNLIKNTSDSNATGGDEFFVKSEITWLSAAIYYVMAVCEGTDECNFNTVMTLLDNSKASDEDENFKSTADLLFEQLEFDLYEENKGHSEYGYADLAVKTYKIFKLAAGKTAQSILVSIGVRLSILNLQDLRELLSKDELHLEHFGTPMIKNKENPNDLSLDIDRETWETIRKIKLEEELEKNPNFNYNPDDYNYEKIDSKQLRKTILFIIISDSRSTFRFLSSIILQQMYEILYDAADKRADSKLPIHTRIINDEFAACGKQPDYNQKISTMRSRNISASVIIQGISQIKSNNLYGDDWEEIFENCDSTLFLGSKGQSTLELVEKLAGKETVNIKTESVTKGMNGSYTQGEQSIARNLYEFSELATLPFDRCLVHIRGYHIFEDKKYDVKKHPNVYLTMDAETPNAQELNQFVIQDYLKTANVIDEKRKKNLISEIKKNTNYDMEEEEALESGEIFSNGKIDEIHQEIFLNHGLCGYIQEEIEEEISSDIGMSLLP